nr:C-C motif chemokine 2-like [Misgurnus anguillicaudatus]
MIFRTRQFLETQHNLWIHFFTVNTSSKTMRHLMVLLFLVIFCSLPLHASFSHILSKSTCCSDFFNDPIPLKRVKLYYRTGSSCSKPAIVFETDQKKICVDPQANWVKHHISEIDKRTTTTRLKTQKTLVRKPNFKTKNTETSKDSHDIAKKNNMRTITTPTTQTITRLFQEPDFTTVNIKGDKFKMCLASKI